MSQPRPPTPIEPPAVNLGTLVISIVSLLTLLILSHVFGGWVERNNRPPIITVRTVQPVIYTYPPGMRSYGAWGPVPGNWRYEHLLVDQSTHVVRGNCTVFADDRGAPR